jgi:predicted DNA-binding transcriptional regulator YafY
MRADRLISLLMLLQARGRMTARALAAELEVSERTIYRDVEALSASGVPIYAEAGPLGGLALLDSYRTTLTGLTESEVRALFMLNIPAPLTTLGVSQELRSALLKLSAALPDARRQDEAQVRQRFYLDSSWWHQNENAVPHLQTIHQAVWQDRKLHLTYRPIPTVEIEQCVDPYGLVAKAGIWYLVCAREGRVRAHQVASLLDARMSEETFERPPDFDLAAFWQTWCAEREQRDTAYPVTLRVAPNLVPALPMYFDSVRDKIGQTAPDADGWITLELAFESLTAARDRLLSFGRGVEVIRPLALRKSIQDYAEQIVALYAQ